MATVLQHLPNHHITATCRLCGRARRLDLAGLAERWGDTDLADLPLRCTGEVWDGPTAGACGGQRFSWIISPIRTGAAR